MSTWQQVFLVARRDFMQRARSRSFLATMAFIVALILIGGPFLSNASQADLSREVGLVGAVPDDTDLALESSGQAVDLEVTTTRYDTLDAAEAALSNGDVDALLVAGTADVAGESASPPTIVWQEQPDPRLQAALQSGVSALTQQEQAQTLGLTPEQQRQLLAPEQAMSRSLQARAEDDDVRQGVAFAAMLLLYLSVVLFGQFVMIGVMEEKANRVVEVLLSRVRAYQLLAGKVMGIGALAVLQIIVLAAALYYVADRYLLEDGAGAAGIGLGLIVPLIGWFLLGFVFFAVLYAALGATVTRQEDAQGVALLPIAVILPAYFIGIYATGEPDAPLVQVASWIPPFSPFVMPIRSAATDVPGWQVALAALVLVVATYGMIRLAGRIYTGAILSVGQKVSLRQAWRGVDRTDATP